MRILDFTKRKSNAMDDIAKDEIRNHIIDSLPLNSHEALDAIESDMMAVSNVLIGLKEDDKLIITMRHNGSGYVISGRFNYETPFYGHSELTNEFVYRTLDAAFSLFLNQVLSLKKHNISIIPNYPKGESRHTIIKKNYTGDMYLVLRKINN